MTTRGTLPALISTSFHKWFPKTLPKPKESGSGDSPESESLEASDKSLSDSDSSSTSSSNPSGGMDTEESP